MSNLSGIRHADPLSVLEVHLDAVARNWLSLKKRLKNGADCAGVVKADGYGLGAAKVAATLFEQGCRHFFVAHVDEAQALLPLTEDDKTAASVYVLNGPQGAAAKDFVHHGLIPVLSSMEDIRYWSQEAAGSPCVIHIDTGMNRLGLGPKDVKALAEDRTLLGGLDIRYVMSHLACGDEPDHPLNTEQLELFQNLSSSLQRPMRLSFANSSGIFLGTDYHFDLARPGCALYGINPTAGDNPMLGTVTLRAKVIQIREIETSGTVGYGASYRVAPPAKTATVSIGYADGYLRSLTGKGAVFINGVKCPVIGRVSMDTVITDVSHVTDFGDGYAEIIGKNQTVDEVAAQAGTIGYEILTSLGKRYKRVY